MRLLTTTILTGLLASAAQADTLRMSWWGGDARHAQTQEALNYCGPKHGHDIQAEFTGWSGHQERITTQIAGRTEADIMQINWPWLPLFSPDGTGFADLYEYDHIIDLSQFTEAQLAGGEVAGKLNGIPVSTTGRVYFFNKTTFERAGLDVPTTWQDVIDAAPVLRAELGPDYYPFEAAGLNAIFLVSMAVTQATGKDLIDPETTTVAWTEEELLDGIRFYQSLVEAGAIREWRQVAGEGNIELFEMRPWSDGRIAGTYEWDSAYAKYADPLGGDQVLVPVPMLMTEGAVTEATYSKPSMLFSISRNSDHPEAAAEIINCLLNDPEAIEILTDSRGVPASKVAFGLLNENDLINPNVAAANAIVLDGTGPVVSSFNEHPRVRDAFRDNLEGVAYGIISAEDAAADIISSIDRALRQFR
ncbi:ABC transporter substrate-binding protein [Roseinatronobacter alkalisoli]|uniref:ABC transporter substrate-binding protein n=1 Tax=Roseinatronobacter alkalisoli TaxID=3028235 RepID=A0ABT5TE95_9RHOB|nr:ABC transporter substrate-binding protein [Roseinatronobacter sp. HJB301]MDD7972228.1 ABC transporter substrate-binding protein [Roseinatronobacter sp. HJB301]